MLKGGGVRDFSQNRTERVKVINKDLLYLLGLKIKKISIFNMCEWFCRKPIPRVKGLRKFNQLCGLKLWVEGKKKKIEIEMATIVKGPD